MSHKNKLYWLSFLLVLLFVFMPVTITTNIVHAENATETSEKKELNAETKQIQQGIFGDKKLGKDSELSQKANYIEKGIAYVINAVPKFLLWLFNLKDLNELIFNTNSSDMKYGTFPNQVWAATDNFYTLFVNISGYLLVIAIMIWGFLIMFRAGSPLAQNSMREMSKGVLVYVCGIYFGSYLFELIFSLNDLVVSWAKAAMQVNGLNIEKINLLDMFVILSTGEDIGHALLYLSLILSVSVLNYQYALRMVVLMFLIIIFPVCAYASIFPGTQKSLDVWFREFASQVFINAGHALAFALFFILLANHSSIWILLAMMFGLPSISGLIRLIFGAPGGLGPVSNMGGGSLGSMAALVMMLRKGKGVGAGKAGIPSAAVDGISTKSEATGAKGLMSNMLGLQPNASKLDVAKSVGKNIGKIGGKAMLYSGAAMASGAMTGNPATGVAAVSLATDKMNDLANKVKAARQISEKNDATSNKNRTPSAQSEPNKTPTSPDGTLTQQGTGPAPIMEPAPQSMPPSDDTSTLQGVDVPTMEPAPQSAPASSGPSSTSQRTAAPTMEPAPQSAPAPSGPSLTPKGTTPTPTMQPAPQSAPVPSGTTPKPQGTAPTIKPAPQSTPAPSGSSSTPKGTTPTPTMQPTTQSVSPLSDTTTQPGSSSSNNSRYTRNPIMEPPPQHPDK